MNEYQWILAGITLAGLLALIPAWRLGYRLFFLSRYPVLAVLLIIIVTALLGAPAFYFPFLLSRGATVEPLNTLIDLLLFGAFPLGAVAMVAYVLDHMQERLAMVLVACAACFALALLPIAYWFLADQMHVYFDITLVGDLTEQEV